ncbi:MAG: DNA polymerase III subunit chi [Cycloclasticus sp. Phe_18]|jgi:DNA polymerase-3 subunit chi|nr:MAG: DNA polymerase III subunit chi [Cycloclasticus sp. Phe_18]MDF1689088.1 DNA polymerase III subunit chi [Cycloclasticus sp.]
MTRIDFYVLPDDSVDAQHIFACRLAQKASKQGHRVYIHTESESQSKKLDDLLWSFSATSFVPHTMKSDECANTPVYINHSGDPLDIHDVLINLTPNTPECFGRFERFAELVNQDESVKQAGRERFKFYKSRGYPLQTHKI